MGCRYDYLSEPTKRVLDVLDFLIVLAGGLMPRFHRHTVSAHGWKRVCGSAGGTGCCLACSGGEGCTDGGMEVSFSGRGFFKHKHLYPGSKTRYTW